MDRQSKEIAEAVAALRRGEVIGLPTETVYGLAGDASNPAAVRHIFQLKATDGDNGAPLIVLSILNGADNAAVRFWPGDSKSFVVARQFKWKPDAWQTVKIRVKTSTKRDGEVMVSVDGDDFQGVKDVNVFRPDATDYRPKWGLYRGTSKDLPEGASYIEHRNASARKL